MDTRIGSDIGAVARVAVFAALIAGLGLVPPIGGIVPITAQTLGVMLAGAVLGPWAGAAAVVVLEVLVALGLPLLAGGHGGAAAFVGPTAGYLVGWIPGALVIGLIAHAGGGRPLWWRTALGSIVGGIVVIYAIGIPVVSLVTGLPLGGSALSSLVFIPGDLIKVVLTTVVTMALWRAYPRAFPARTHERRAARSDGTTGAPAREEIPAE
ncbi:biotin transporter BioY [Microbacterium sp. RD1]|uniref:biotin transporter BioY n=1 Tax=Microbacterium sp. RD1 TaxID=3457313 RepID=UPI003FA53A37